MNKMIRIIALILIVTCFISCSINKSVANIQEDSNKNEYITSENNNENNEKAEEIKDEKQEVTFGDYRIFGSSSAIISFTIDESLDFDFENVEVTAVQRNDLEEIKVKAELYRGVYYARLEGLKDDSNYDVKINLNSSANPLEIESDYSFSTPKRSISPEQLQLYIDEELIDCKYSDKDNVLIQTQACLSLLGFEVGRIGRFNDIAQANLCRYEYSVNKLNDYVYYENIVAHPNEKTLELLKDILSVDIDIQKEDILQNFVKTNSYNLSEYAIIDDEGGKIDIEHYILDILENDNELNEIYKSYPFVIDTIQFKEKYAEYYTGSIYDVEYEQKLKQYAAKNKALFSYYACDILKELAKPKDRLVYFFDQDKSTTVYTMIAYSYMFMDALEKTGLHFEISTAYRDYDFQWLLYSQKNGKSVAKNRNANWHYNRQILSYVPGFSNHQYGISIDFHERTTFGQTKLYKYLLEYGENYGFYNYNIEPWHWSYLGKLD